MFWGVNEKESTAGKNARWKKHQIGRERPHFFGFQPPKKFGGSLPPCGTSSGAHVFSTGPERVPGVESKRRNIMSIIKKAPAILTREFRMEEPVSVLLDDYAQFIESSPDHVINAALKKTLWRDQDYRKWREQRKNTGGDTAKRGAAEGPAKS